MSDNTQELITYGIDEGSPDGDKTALSIKQGNRMFTFVGEEAEAIAALIKSQTNQAVLEALEKFGLKKGVKYDIRKSDKVIVITESELTQEVQTDE